MRTFFRDIFPDPAALADLMVFGGREQSRLHGNRDVTKSKDTALVGSMGLVNTSNDFGASKAPAGLDLVTKGLQKAHLVLLDKILKRRVPFITRPLSITEGLPEPPIMMLLDELLTRHVPFITRPLFITECLHWGTTGVEVDFKHISR